MTQKNLRQITLFLSSLCLLILFHLHPLHAQESDSVYFQQNVVYNIDVTLNDQLHQLNGNIRIGYTNNSPDELKRMAIHLWPNAYKSKETVLAKQLLKLGDIQFYNAELKDLGFIDSIEFRLDGKKLAFSFDPEYGDIGWVRFPTPLKPGQTIEIESPFRVQIPGSFSRLGHVGQTYQVTQWYPKPAVYNHFGWQIMPYLDQGEFFSEFAHYNVQITLPENYVVAATGDLVTEAEIQFLNDRIHHSKMLPVTNEIVLDTIPKSLKKNKTIEFTAHNVHDFAWFADKRFRIDTSSVFLANGNKVDTRAFYTKSESEYWQNATTYLNRSVQYYSNSVGPYAWSHATAVQSPLSKGGGMEYPMITLIGLSFSEFALDQVITHEVGHNWFYGMLASNERQFSWMDEGLNSFFESAYLKKYYQNTGNEFIPKILTRSSDMRNDQALYIDLVNQNKLLPGKTDPFDQNELSYYLNAYEIPAMGITLLRDYMGADRFRNAIEAYFNRWKFKHPYPKDFKEIFETHCSCDLSWLTRGLLQDGGYIDYAIIGIQEGELVLENRGSISAPVEIIRTHSTGEKNTIWIEGFEGIHHMTMDQEDISLVQLYEPGNSLDVDWSNNHYRSKGIFKNGRPLKIGLIAGLERSDRNQVFLFPALGLNQADEGMVGVGLTNLKLPNPALRWIFAPMYSIGAQNIVGMGEVRRDFKLNNGIADRVTVRAAIKKFSYNYDAHYQFIDQYDKIEGEAILHFRRPEHYSSIDQKLSFRFANIHQEFGTGLDFENFLYSTNERSYYVSELQYNRKSDYVLAPSNLTLTAHQGKGFLRLTSNFRQKLTYNQESKGLFIHLFGGLLAKNADTEANVNFIFNGQSSNDIFSKDYLYDEILFGRNATKGILSQQVFQRDAELKTLSIVGNSESWMIGAGISSSLPLPLPIHFYLDAAFYPSQDNVQFSYSSGLAVVFAKDFFEVYLPIFESKDIRESTTYDSPSHDTFLKRISFLINLKKLHPFEMSNHFFEFLY